MFKCGACKQFAKKPNMLVRIIRRVKYYHGSKVSNGFETIKEEKLCDSCFKFLKAVDVTISPNIRRITVEDHRNVSKMQKRLREQRSEA